MKLWGGRFKKDADLLVEEFTSSVAYDRRLALYDLQGSRAHVEMLVKQEIIETEQGEAILQGLSEIEDDIKDGSFEFTEELEDVHLNIERSLIDRIGPVGGKLHTGRSRNDQVALDLRLYLRHQLELIGEQLLGLLSAIVQLAERGEDIVMPGYTHLQRAQPVRFGHHLLAYYQMFSRDLDRFQDCYRRLDVMPLGSGALAATPLPLDREFVAEKLGFSRVSSNSMDAVSDRDYVFDFMSAATLTGIHLSRLSSDLILWSSTEFNFIELDDSFCTGSSIMPQKKNPDVAELIRGKSGRLSGNLVSLLTVIKGLPLTYNRDLQEDKEPLFDTVDTILSSLQIMARMLVSMEINSEEMMAACSSGFLNATDVADYLVSKGLPFREAHRVVGNIVLYCLEGDKILEDLSDNEWKSFSELIEPEIRERIDIENSVEARNIKGGPAREQVTKELTEAKKKIEELDRQDSPLRG